MGGSIAVQLAVAAGVSVTATASRSKIPETNLTKMEWVESLGAKNVIDYRTSDWLKEVEKEGNKYDVVFDCVGDEADVDRAAKIVRPGGKFVTIANFSAKTPRVGNMEVATFIVRANGEDLQKLVNLNERGKLEIPVDSVFQMENLPLALERSMTSRATGKIIGHRAVVTQPHVSCTLEIR